MTEIITLDASAAHLWLTCALRQTHRTLNHTPREAEPYDPVAARFGNLVHSALTGEAMSFSRPVEYDEYTPDKRTLDHQVNDACEALNTAIKSQECDGYKFNVEMEYTAKVGDREIKVVGRADIIGIKDGNANIIELKTGIRPLEHYYWPQLAVYAWLSYHAGHDEDTADVDTCTVLHYNRAAPYQQTFSIMQRPSEPLIGQATEMIRYILHSLAAPVANPGLYCAKCENPECVYHPEWEERSDWD